MNALENSDQEPNRKRECRKCISHLSFCDVDETLEGGGEEAKFTADTHVSVVNLTFINTPLVYN